MVNILYSCFLFYIIASIVAVSLQLHLSTSVLAKGIVLYKTVRPFRISLHVVLTGFLCFVFFWYAGNKMVSAGIFLSPYYKMLTILAILVALRSELQYVTSLWTYARRGYKTVRGVRVSLLFLLAVIGCYVFYRFTGDRFIYFLLLFTPEYFHLTVVAIIAFFILFYVRAKNEYENLNVFGSVLLISWVILFAFGVSLHITVHFKLLEKAISLFDYLNRVLPGRYKSLPYIILACWIINVFALLYVTGSRITNILMDHVVKKIRDSYQEKVIELVYDDTYDNRSIVIEPLYFKKVRRLFFTRQLFSDELLRMHEIVYGGLHDRINQLFHSLLLTKDAFNYLHNRRWFYKIKGLRIYAELGDNSQIAYIEKLIHSKNFDLRFEAQLALARLNEDERPLHYLKDLKEKLSLWEQLNLIYFYTNHQKPVGDLSGLLESANVTVICFGLQCIRKFNKVEYRSRIIDLTTHTDLNVQNAAFQTLGLYDEPETGSYLLSRYDKTLIASTRLIIIRSLGQTGDVAVIPFLKEQLSSTVNQETTLELLKALIQIDSKQASDLADFDYFKFRRLYEHVTETLL